MNNVFFEIHSNLPREAPGDDESTKKAFQMLKDLPQKPRILDVGCGPGMQTIVIAKVSNGTIKALDNHQPFLDSLRIRAEAEGVSGRISLINADMASLKFVDGSFDLIWSEGAIYIIGFERGICEWKRLLAEKGNLVVSELCWLKPDPPKEVKEFFMKVYPAMKTIQENIAIIERADYRLINHFVLPDESWWKNYYIPISKKLPSLKVKYKDDMEALDVLKCEELEIETFRKYSSYYGYVFYIMQL